MATKNIFVNMMVKDLNKSMEFFKKLGWSFNEQFTDETAASLIISENIYCMLLTQEKMKQFTSKELVDPSKSTEVLLAISTESKQEVDELVDKALEAGATKQREPEDYGFMYSRSFNDLDGHIWEVFYMDPNYVQK